MEISLSLPCRTVSQAARYGRLEDLKRLICRGHPVDVSDNRGWKPIHEAAHGNHTDCLAELLKQEATAINWQAFDGSTALLEAAKAGHEGCLNIILAAGADPNLTDNFGVTPLMAATESHSSACVMSLISHGANINHQQYSGLSALHLCVEADLPEILNQLLENGASPEVKNDNGMTPLFVAAHYGHLECLTILLQHLCDRGQSEVVNFCAKDGASPLFLAAQEGHTDCLRLLLAHSSNANLTTSSPVALPLHAALEFNHIDCIKLLLPHTDRQILSSCCTSPYYFSLLHDDDVATNCLIEAGLDFNNCMLNYDYHPRVLRYFSSEVHFSNTVSALSLVAINRNKISHAQALMAAGASLNTVTASGIPPLLAALDNFNLPFAHLLIKNGAQVNLYHPKVIGNLTIIVSMDKWKCLNFVLQCGAEVESLFHSDQIDRAIQGRYLGYSRFLEESDNDDYEAEPGLLKTPIPFWRMLAETRYLTTKAGITVAQALYRILQFTSNVKLDPHIYSYIDLEKDKETLRSVTESPRCLMHLCRLVIRSRFSSRKLLDGDAIRLLPLPDLLLDYIQYVEAKG